MISEEIDNESTDPVSAKNKCCICFNHSLPDKNGNRIISPCCPVHYSIHIPPEKKIANTAKDHADWRTPEKNASTAPK